MPVTYTNRKEVTYTLEDEERRLFRAERICYRSSVDGWLSLWNVSDAPIEMLTRRLIPTLGVVPAKVSAEG
jgi:hypothetical protein